MSGSGLPRSTSARVTIASKRWSTPWRSSFGSTWPRDDPVPRPTRQPGVVGGVDQLGDAGEQRQRVGSLADDRRHDSFQRREVHPTAAPARQQLVPHVVGLGRAEEVADVVEGDRRPVLGDRLDDALGEHTLAVDDQPVEVEDQRPRDDEACALVVAMSRSAHAPRRTHALGQAPTACFCQVATRSA